MSNYDYPKFRKANSYFIVTHCLLCGACQSQQGSLKETTDSLNNFCG